MKCRRQRLVCHYGIVLTGPQLDVDSNPQTVRYLAMCRCGWRAVYASWGPSLSFEFLMRHAYPDLTQEEANWKALALTKHQKEVYLTKIADLSNAELVKDTVEKSSFHIGVCSFYGNDTCA